ncbi:MAG TPA: SGNH/GDSL hydrolase family protein [Burkholderiales bacterium]|nr:SGNH/GDSL hydrolase family protein [Burkholderiales bacterium]
MIGPFFAGSWSEIESSIAARSGWSLEILGTPKYRASTHESPVEEKSIKSWLQNAILLGASLCVALVLGELLLRIIDFSYPIFYTYDDVVGVALRPGAEGWNRTEGEALIKISSDGLRDREHSKKKPPGTIRIAVLGDSMAEALQVPLDATFWSVAGRRVKECKAFGGRDIEVLNFGVSGYGTAQELLTLRHRVAAYAPDIVVLAFYAGNDVRNNSRELEPMKLRPFFRVENGALVEDDGFLSDPEYLSYKRTFGVRKTLFDLRTFQLLRRARVAVEQLSAGKSRTPRSPNTEPGVDEKIFLPPDSASWRDAWDLTERLVVEIRDEAAGMGARFLLVAIPIGIQVNPDPKVRDQFARGVGAGDLLYVERRLRALGDRRKLDVLLLAPPLQAYAERNHVYLHGFPNTRPGSGHLNEKGHQLAGELISERICRPR